MTLPKEVTGAMNKMKDSVTALSEQEQKLETMRANQIAKEKVVYEALSADFPTEAYSKDTSRGFALTSVKAQYIVERLNEVLGVAGWSTDGTFEQVKDSTGKTTGVLFHGELRTRIGNVTHTVKSPGYSDVKKNLGDAYKGAKTDSLSKAASFIGVANEVFKGQVDPNTIESTSAEILPKAKPTGNASFATGLKNKSATAKNDPFSL